MPSEIRRLAEFLKIPIDEQKWQSTLDHCSFDYIKANGTKSVPLGGAFWDGGAQTFIHKGTNGRWRDVLQQGEVERYERFAEQELCTECARWLSTGEM
jgi:aryl sulfotransferase